MAGGGGPCEGRAPGHRVATRLGAVRRARRRAARRLRWTSPYKAVPEARASHR